jgi:hypothetical protein
VRDELPAAGLKNPRAFTWVKTADEILETLAAYCGLIYFALKNLGDG